MPHINELNVEHKLKRHQWSFDNDPNGELKKAVLELIA
jgi:hypothetical protein